MEKLTLLLAFLTLSAHATRIRVPSECEVRALPKDDSKIVCRLSKKSSVEILSKTGDFYKAKREDCNGYIPRSCLQKPKRAGWRSRRTRRTASEEETPVPVVPPDSERKIRIGIRAAFEGINAKVPYSTARSKGLGFSLGGTGTYTLIPTVRFTGALSYHFQRLSRTLSGSELYTDPGTEVSNQVHSLGLLLGASYGFSASLFSDSGGSSKGYFNKGKKKPTSKPLFWTDAGIELTQPLLSRQSSGSISSSSAAAGRGLYLFSGVSTSFGIGAKDLGLGLQFRLNLAGATGTSILGGLLYVELVL